MAAVPIDGRKSGACRKVLNIPLYFRNVFAFSAVVYSVYNLESVSELFEPIG
jgi:hypothetical protein